MSEILVHTGRLGASGPGRQRLGRFAAVIGVDVDVRDVQRGIIDVRERLTLQSSPHAGRLTMLYPEWVPGYHAPEAPLELLAGLRFSAQGRALTWRRDPVAVHAFHIDMPADGKVLEIEFQLLCPTAEEQGRVGTTLQHVSLQWNSVLLYPAGYRASQIEVTPAIRIPEGWQLACALQTAESADGATIFAPAPLDMVVDSPLFAGPHYRRYPLDPAVALNVFGDEAQDVEVGERPLAILKGLVAEADSLFGARHFKRYEFLIAASDELGDLGVEHQQSTEMVVPRNFFTGWREARSKKDVLAHEYVHSWNGKFRRGRDACTNAFDEPIRNSLMWVYEGLTQYWGQVLAVRAGLWDDQTFKGALARTAAQCTNMAGRRWRPLQDTVSDPIISGRKALPWESWQRNQDYYTDGQLIWLDADTIIRELSEEKRSLDDFGRDFFGVQDGHLETLPYDFEDVVESLGDIAAFDWSGFFRRKLMLCDPEPPLAGIVRAGYALTFQEAPSDFQRAEDESAGQIDLTFSLGLSASTDGKIQEVIWDSPAFYAGVTAGSEILMVNGREFSRSALEQAVGACAESGAVRLTVKKLKHAEELEILYTGRHRYPHLVRDESHPARLDQILRPRR